MCSEIKNISDTLKLLELGTLDVEGLLPWSSNYTFLARICPNTAVRQALPHLGKNDLFEIKVVYKPRRGERPLWDFPQGTLCNRESAAFLVSHALGWDLVPPTVLRDGPHGIGSVQLFVDHDPDRHYFTIEGDPAYRKQLQKIALMDILINNADRKAGHVLLTDHQEAEQLRAIDHGICFHTEYKLRTVIWEFAAAPIPAPLLASITHFDDRLATNKDGLRHNLQQLLTKAEITALRKRLKNMLDQGTFLTPGPGRHYPWPPV